MGLLPKEEPTCAPRAPDFCRGWGPEARDVNMPFVSSSSVWAEPAARGSPRMHSSLCIKVASPQESWWGPHFTQISRGLFAAPDLFFFR